MKESIRWLLWNWAVRKLDGYASRWLAKHGTRPKIHWTISPDGTVTAENKCPRCGSAI